MWLINLILTSADGKQSDSCCTPGLWFQNGIGWATSPAIWRWISAVSSFSNFKLMSHQALQPEEIVFSWIWTQSLSSTPGFFHFNVECYLLGHKKVFSFVPPNYRPKDVFSLVKRLLNAVSAHRKLIVHFKPEVFNTENVELMKKDLVQLLHCFGLEIHHAQGDSIPVWIFLPPLC